MCYKLVSEHFGENDATDLRLQSYSAVNFVSFSGQVYRWCYLLYKMSRRNEDRFEGKSPPPFHMTITKGSVHIVAVRGFVEYVVHNSTAVEFLDWVKDTYIPDETFFSSLNHNPHLKAPGSYLGLLYTNCYCQIFINRLFFSSCISARVVKQFSNIQLVLINVVYHKFRFSRPFITFKTLFWLLSWLVLLHQFLKQWKGGEVWHFWGSCAYIDVQQETSSKQVLGHDAVQLHLCMESR